MVQGMWRVASLAVVVVMTPPVSCEEVVLFDCTAHMLRQDNECKTASAGECLARPAELQCGWCPSSDQRVCVAEGVTESLFRCSYKPAGLQAGSKCRVRGACTDGGQYEATLTEGCLSATCGGSSGVECERRVGEGRIAIKGFKDLRNIRAASAVLEPRVLADLMASLGTRHISILSSAANTAVRPHLYYVYFNVSAEDLVAQSTVTYNFIQQQIQLRTLVRDLQYLADPLQSLAVDYTKSSAPYFGPPPPPPEKEDDPFLSGGKLAAVIILATMVVVGGATCLVVHYRFTHQGNRAILKPSGGRSITDLETMGPTSFTDLKQKNCEEHARDENIRSNRRVKKNGVPVVLGPPKEMDEMAREPDTTDDGGEKISDNCNSGASSKLVVAASQKAAAVAVACASDDDVSEVEESVDHENSSSSKRREETQSSALSE